MGSSRKSFLLRLPPELHEQLRRWAGDEMRSLNAHLEYLLRDAVRRAGRPAPPAADDQGDLDHDGTGDASPPSGTPR